MGLLIATNNYKPREGKLKNDEEDTEIEVKVKEKSRELKGLVRDFLKSQAYWL